VRDIEAVAARLGLETGGAIGRDAIAKLALGATKFAGAANLLGQLFITPRRRLELRLS
jgi:hypothetical protein